MKIVLSAYKIRPKARPRLGKRGQVYSPSASLERKLAWLIREQAGNTHFTRTVRVSIVIHSKGVLRGDNDNYEKLVWDSLQKAGVLSNDKLIRENSCLAISGATSDRLEIEITPLLRQDILDLRATGKSIREIAKAVGLSKSQIHRYITQSVP